MSSQNDPDTEKLLNPATSPTDMQKALRHLGGINITHEIREGIAVDPGHEFLVIALGGYYGAGKDVYADALVYHSDFEKTFMSKNLQRCIQTMNPRIELSSTVRFTDENGYLVEFEPFEQIRYNDLERAVGYEGAKKQIEVRDWLQVMGTEIGRKILGEDTWVKLVREDLCEIKKSGRHAVLTGVRYENELEMVREFGAKLVWVTRPGFEPTGATGQHSSERTLTPADFDYEMLNDGSLEDLERRAVAQANAWLAF